MQCPRLRTAASFLASGGHHRPRACSRACASSSPYRTTEWNKPFTVTSARLYARGREPNLYEILDVPITASMPEIKKQFYSLSLAHHPDRNRTDPTASSRFARISSAYETLSNASRRAAYDRDHGIVHANTYDSGHAGSTHSTANPGQHPMGSHSSYSANVHSKGGTYAGSRPASGLSRRRGVFKGPPPSFYAHGGFGGRTARDGAGTGGATGTGTGAGGRASPKDEDDPTAFVDRNTLHHFNARGHYRTQTAEDMRRRERRSRAMGAALNEQYIGNSGDFALRFVVVVGILLGAGVLTGIFWPKEAGGQRGFRRRGRGES